ncbi:MAG TPA: SWIM zinc finger family protein [Micromonosporaceae bacterium]|jgi:uncharacterized Zn finger protein
MPIGPDGWFEARPPIRVEGGLRARSRRGPIGEHWWSRRFIDLLEGICDPGRLARGRTYARRGQVVEMDVAPGVVTARVQGSRPAPYRASIRIQAYAEGDWAEIERTLAGQALYRAALLAGDMPPEILGVFDALGRPLFPSTLDMSCSCPDLGVPCKHLSAVLYLLAEAFDDDPFLVLAWRGRARADLLDALRGLVDEEPADPLHVPDVPLADRLDDFYSPAVSLGRLRELRGWRAAEPAPSDLLLRALQPPPVTVRHRPLVDVLRAPYVELPLS